MLHSKFPEVHLLISENIPILLHGERGSGKTTLISQVAEALSLPFYAVSMTRQTTLSNLLGFMNVNGVYVPSLFRKAIEFGGVFLLDEIDAADPNVILAFNTIENGFVSFPDKIVDIHPDFRLAATANSFTAYDEYTGRAKLDAATLDRFDKIELPHDGALEASLVSAEAFDEIERIRSVVTKNNMAIHISMRDALRWDKRKKLNLTENYIQKVLLNSQEGLYEQFLETVPKVMTRQQDITTLDELWKSIQPR